MEKVTRRVIKRWSGKYLCIPFLVELAQTSTEHAQDHGDLGATLNGFSLHESGALSGAIEKAGQAVDVTYMSTTKLVRKLHIS